MTRKQMFPFSETWKSGNLSKCHGPPFSATRGSSEGWCFWGWELLSGGVGYLDVSENSGTPKSSILIGFSIIFTIHLGVPLFLEIPI